MVQQTNAHNNNKLLDPKMDFIVKPDLKVHHFSAIKKQTPRRKSAPLLAKVS